ncbi:MAG: hypothetical protein HOP17_09955 [Acidobacteria bacterium]|nr:hypothetical protein [Acidobacteriota bacterium]
MPFDPKILPPGVYTEFKKGPKYWPLVVQRDMEAYIFDLTKLTDIIFYLHHPERIGNPLKPHESKLINQWKAFRTTITPWVEQKRSALYAGPRGCWPCGIEGTDVGP